MLLREYWHVFLIEGVSYTLLLSVITVFFGAIWVASGPGKALPISARARHHHRICGSNPRNANPFTALFRLFYSADDGPGTEFECVHSICIALVINSSAYVSEVIRSGIQAVDHGQTEAARSLGLNARQTMLRIILPQAVKNILPALGNEFVMMIKETSLASTFFVGELMTSYLKVKGATWLNLESLIIVGAIYFVITFTLSKVVAVFERRMRAGE